MMRRNIPVTTMFANPYTLGILGYIGFAYYALMYNNVLVKDQKNAWDWVHIGVLHSALFLLLSSFIQTIISEPGKVPLFWGFFLDAPDTQRRRYCLICHIFKPERSHHCSACNKCVLNMDHHCQWLNNCVGFHNRKFFMLVLFYAVFIMAETFVYYLPLWVDKVVFLVENSFDAPTSVYLTVVLYVLNLGTLIMISLFFMTHCRYVRDNITTIEFLDQRRQEAAGATTGGRPDTPNYDMGPYYNFIQIFGRNPWLWPFPVFFESGRPVGDGVVWPQRPAHAQQYEIDMSIRNATAEL